MLCLFFFFKQKTAYEMRISDWSSDVCSSDLTRCPMRCPTHVLSPMMADIPATTQRPLIASGVASYRSTGFSNCFVAASLAKAVPFISFAEDLIWPSPAFQAVQHRCTRAGCPAFVHGGRQRLIHKGVAGP